MKQTITIPAPAALGPYSHACKINGFVYTSGQLGIDPATGKMPADVAEQTRLALENLKNVLAAADMGLADVVKTTVFVTDLANFATVNSVYGKYFTENWPCRSCVQVAALPAGGLVEIEAVASK